VPIERINPSSLVPYPGMSHIVRATGGTTLYLSGQGAYTKDGALVGPGDYYAQSKQAFANVLEALKAAGATIEDVVKITYYIVRLDPKALEDFSRAMVETLGEQPAAQPAATMVGVQALGYEEMLVEIDVTAVVS
jgi:enamine deaminase RidA (YjgF/YER057c/UK114 family)